MSRSDIMKFLKAKLEEVAGIEPSTITEDSTIDGDLEMNSVTFVELQVALEDGLDVAIDPIVVVEFNRLGPIVDYLASLVEEKAP